MAGGAHLLIRQHVTQRHRRWWGIAAACAVAIYLPGWMTLQRLAFRRGQLNDELTRLTRENQTLAEERHQLLTNPRYVEAVARRQLRATRKGELVLKLEPQTAAAASARRPPQRSRGR